MKDNDYIANYELIHRIPSVVLKSNETNATFTFVNHIYNNDNWNQIFVYNYIQGSASKIPFTNTSIKIANIVNNIHHSFLHLMFSSSAPDHTHANPMFGRHPFQQYNHLTHTHSYIHTYSPSARTRRPPVTKRSSGYANIVGPRTLCLQAAQPVGR